jgi:hypothetical protein
MTAAKFKPLAFRWLTGYAVTDELVFKTHWLCDSRYIGCPWWQFSLCPAGLSLHFTSLHLTSRKSPSWCSWYCVFVNKCLPMSIVVMNYLYWTSDLSLNVTMCTWVCTHHAKCPQPNVFETRLKFGSTMWWSWLFNVYLLCEIQTHNHMRNVINNWTWMMMMTLMTAG